MRSGSRGAARRPPPAPVGGDGGSEARARWSTTRVLLGAASVSYLTGLAALVSWATVPLLLGWSTYAVGSDSMAPAVRTGDVLVSAPVDPATLEVGDVAVVDDPAIPGRRLSHRVARILSGGVLITRGDANADVDTTEVPPDRVLGVARLRIPFVGLPGHWLVAGQPLRALAWLAATALAVVAAVTDPARRRSGRRPRTLPPSDRPSRRRRGVLAGAATALTLAVAATVAPLAPPQMVSAAFAGAAFNGTNSFAARTDWVAPDASAVTVAKTLNGYLTGVVKPNASYRVYANVTDAGNPPSGISSVRTTTPAVRPLTAASSTVGGVGYNYRSAAVQDAAPEGSQSYDLELVDAAANTRTRTGYPIVYDSTPPTAVDVQAVNKSGGTSGQPEAGDTLVLTYSEQIDPFSVLSGWTGSGQTITLRIAKSGSTNIITLRNGAAVLPLGTVTTVSAYVSANRDFTGSTMNQSGNTISVVLGTPSGSITRVTAAAAMSWSPDAAAYDAGGNNATTAAQTETGTNDADF